MKRFLISVLLFIATVSCLPAQSRVDIPVGSTIELSWLPSPDMDVTRYDAYFVSEVFVDTVKLAITEFSTVGDTNVVTVVQALPLGDGHCRMTATDSLGLRSEFSTDRAEYTVTNAAPRAPAMIQIKVVAAPQVKALKVGSLSKKRR